MSPLFGVFCHGWLVKETAATRGKVNQDGLWGLPPAARKIWVLSLHRSLLNENGVLSFVKTVPFLAHASSLFLSGASGISCIFSIFIFEFNLIVFIFLFLHYYSRSEGTCEQWQWRGMSQSQELGNWNVTIICSLVSYTRHPDPVGWICRIHRLYLCKWVRLP